MDIADIVTKAREVYHTNMVSVVNAANQLKIIKDEKAEELNKNHVMTLITDVYPRLYGKESVEKLFGDQIFI